MRHQDLADVYCSAARTWAVIGDRWTMMILRECFRGKTRFSDLHDKLGLGRNVLTERLDRLVDEGVLERRQYQSRPARFDYRLTERGEGLYPVLLAMIQWGDAYKNDVPPVRLTHKACGHDPLPLNTCAHCGQEFDRGDLRAHFAPNAW